MFRAVQCEIAILEDTARGINSGSMVCVLDDNHEVFVTYSRTCLLTSSENCCHQLLDALLASQGLDLTWRAHGIAIANVAECVG